VPRAFKVFLKFCFEEGEPKTQKRNPNVLSGLFAKPEFIAKRAYVFWIEQEAKN